MQGSAPLAVNPMKVLVIDDDRFFRTILESELRQENMEVLLANNGEEGISMTKELKPDAIVLDLILPKKDGFEVLTALKDLPARDRPAVFVFTSLSQEHDKFEAISLGALQYFTKGEHTVHHIAEAIYNAIKK